MFGSIGMPELIIIFVIALIIFGPRKLPEIGRTLGKGLAEFKKASNELKRSIENEVVQTKPGGWSHPPKIRENLSWVATAASSQRATSAWAKFSRGPEKASMTALI